MAETKLKFLRAAAELFRRQGYSGTGLKQVAATAEAAWGSMYHFFPGGKEQLAAEAVRQAGEFYRASFARLFKAVPDPIEAMQRVFDGEIRVLEGSDYRNGCPVASTALDVASTVDSVRAACSHAFAAWQDEIAAALLGRGMAEAAAAELASSILATLEGAIILARCHRSPAPLKAARHGVSLAIQAALAGVTKK